jgi:YfiH family protein
VHVARVVTVEVPGQHAGEAADGAVTAVPGAVVAVQAADCAPVVLLADGVVGVAHAGWRSLVAGVLPATVAAARTLGAGGLRAVLGPCIHPCCYEFGVEERRLVSAAVGADVAATTRAGRPALDVPAPVAASLAAEGVALDVSASSCTSCDADRHWSHRARQEAGRQAAVAWFA